LIKAEEAAKLAARKGAERQPKKERIGPSVSIGKKAGAGLEAIASGGATLDSVQKVYLEKLETGIGRQAALNATAQKVDAALRKSSESSAASATANKVATASYNEVGARNEKQAANMTQLNAEVGRQSAASGQVGDILQRYKANLQKNQGVTSAMTNAINSVAKEQGGLLGDTKSVRKALIARIKEEKNLANAEKQETDQLKASNPGGKSGGKSGGKPGGKPGERPGGGCTPCPSVPVTSQEGPSQNDLKDDPQTKSAGEGLSKAALLFGSLGIAGSQLAGSLGGLDEAVISTISATTVMGSAILAATGEAVDALESLKNKKGEQLIPKRAISVVKGFGIGLAAGSAALQFFSSQATEAANKAKEQFDKGLKDIAEGGSTTADTLKKAAKTEVEERARSAKLVSTSAFATVGGLAAAGAAIGSFVPGVGTAIGGLIGGLIGATIAIGNAGTARSDISRKEIDSINATIDAMVALSKATLAADKAFKELDELQGLSKEDKTKSSLDITNTLQKETRGKAAEAQNRLAESLSGTGVSVASAKTLDKKDLVAAFKKSGLAQEEAESKASSVKKSLTLSDQASENNERLNEKTRTNLVDAVDIAPLNKSFKQLQSEGTAPVIAALKARKNQISDNIASQTSLMVYSKRNRSRDVMHKRL
jgi:hypothetical protein